VIIGESAGRNAAALAFSLRPPYTQISHPVERHLWDPATGKFVKRLDIGGALAFSPDSTLLAAGSRVWDFAANKEVSANDEAHRSAVSCIVTAQNDLIATAGEDSCIRIWDARTGQHRRRLTFDTSVGLSIRAVALAPDGKLLVSSSMRDDSIYLWDHHCRADGTGPLRQALQIPMYHGFVSSMRR